MQRGLIQQVSDFRKILYTQIINFNLASESKLSKIEERWIFWRKSTNKIEILCNYSLDFFNQTVISCRQVSRSGGGGEGTYVLRQAIKSRLEPGAAKVPPHKPLAFEGLNIRFWLADDSIDVILESERKFLCSLLIGCRQVLGFGHESRVFGFVLI